MNNVLYEFSINGKVVERGGILVKNVYKKRDISTIINNTYCKLILKINKNKYFMAPQIRFAL